MFALSKNDLQAFYLLRVPSGKPNLYEKFTIKNYFNQTKRPPIPRDRLSVHTIPRNLNNRGKNTRGANEFASDVYQVIFHLDCPKLYPAVTINDAGGTDSPAVAAAAPTYQAPTNTAAPKSATLMAIRSGNGVSKRT